MKFSNHTDVEGSFIQGKIFNGKFVLTHITKKKNIAPPLSTICSFSENELNELIIELQKVKERISDEMVRPV